MLRRLPLLAPRAVRRAGRRRGDMRARADATAACFGAAARDREVRCVNRALDLVAIPSPDDALLEPSAPCEPIRRAPPAVCAFGARPVDAVSTSRASGI